MIPFIIAGAVGFGIAKLLEKDNTKKYAEGGGVDDIGEDLENYSDYDEFYNVVFEYIKREENLTEEETKDICITNESIIEAEFDGGSSPRFTGDVVLGYLSNERAYKKFAKGGKTGEKSTKKKTIKKLTKNREPKMVRQYFDDSPYSYADGGEVDDIKSEIEKQERKLNLASLPENHLQLF